MSKKRIVSAEGGERDIRQELAEARCALHEAAKKQPLLKLLLLANPIRAFAEIGIRLSEQACERLREEHPEISWDNDELYDRVSAGELEPVAIDEGGDWSYAAELEAASRAFYQAARERPQLKVLFLVNPIRAFADADIELSRRARKRLREAHPEIAWDNHELFDQVRTGEVVLDFIADVRLGEPKRLASAVAGEEVSS